jgi:hypothetical protein
MSAAGYFNAYISSILACKLFKGINQMFFDTALMVYFMAMLVLFVSSFIYILIP